MVHLRKKRLESSKLAWFRERSARAEGLGLLGALAANLAVTLYLFREVLRDPTGVVIGATNTEAWTFLWGHFVMEDSLRRLGAYPYHLDIADFPSEGVLWLKDPFWTFVMVPLQELIGIPLLYNVESMAQFVLAGVAFYLLCRTLEIGRIVGIAASLSYAFMPHNLGEIYNGNQEALAVCWLPFWLWSMFALLRRPGVIRALVAGAMLFLLLINNQYFGLAMAMASGPLAIMGLWHWREGQGVWKPALWLAGAVGLGVALFWPSYLMINHSIQAPGAITILDQNIQYELPYVSDLRHLWAPLSPLTHSPHVAPPFQDIIYPGFALVGGAILGTFVGCGPWRWLWMPLGLAFLSFSLGPVLSFDGELIRGDGGGLVRLPWGVIGELDPRVGMVTLPHRFAVPAGLFLSLGFASLLDGGVRRWTPRFARVRMVLAMGLGLGVLGEMLHVPPYQVPLQGLELPDHGYFTVLREVDTPGAVLGLPISNGENDLREYLWHQAQHKRAIDASLRKEVVPTITKRVAVLRRIMAAQGNFHRGQSPRTRAERAGETDELPFLPDPDGGAKMVAEGYGFIALHLKHACHTLQPHGGADHDLASWDRALSASFGPGLVLSEETVIYVLDATAREAFAGQAIAILGERQVQPSGGWFAQPGDPCTAIWEG